jgi:methylenetetrahydrofolate dehydrogenase (NADP+)/methenyltetrahydrofolate cyclohydrolase
MILSGKKVAEGIFSEANQIASDCLVRPGLGVVLIGDDPASHLYVGIKERRAEELGFHFRKELLPATTAEDKVIQVIEILNDDPDIHGIIVQLPLPEGLDADRIIGAIDPRKDADGFHPETVRRFLSGDMSAMPVFPLAIMELIRSVEKSISGKRGVIFANSTIFGDIMYHALKHDGIDPTIIPVREIAYREDEIALADVIVSALGVSERFPRDIFKSGSIVIDGGISERDGNVYGDVASIGDDSKIYLTPVPGGVGPVTVACLLRRTAELAGGK